MAGHDSDILAQFARCLVDNHNGTYSLRVTGGSITPGTTPIIGGTDMSILFDDNGTIGESVDLTFDRSSGNKLHLGDQFGNNNLIFQTVNDVGLKTTSNKNIVLSAGYGFTAGEMDLNTHGGDVAIDTGGIGNVTINDIIAIDPEGTISSVFTVDGIPTGYHFEPYDSFFTNLGIYAPVWSVLPRQNFDLGFPSPVASLAVIDNSVLFMDKDGLVSGSWIIADPSFNFMNAFLDSGGVGNISCFGGLRFYGANGISFVGAVTLEADLSNNVGTAVTFLNNSGIGAAGYGIKTRYQMKNVAGSVFDVGAVQYTNERLFTDSFSGWFYLNGNPQLEFRDWQHDDSATFAKKVWAPEVNIADPTSLDSEKLTNGNFESGSTGWTGSAPWSVGAYLFNTTSTLGSLAAGATYTNNGITYTIKFFSTQSSEFMIATGPGDPTASGTLTKTSGTGPATITFGSYDQGAAKTADGTGTLSQTSAAMITPLVPGQTYLLTLNINFWPATIGGSATLSIGGVTLENISSNGFSNGTQVLTYKVKATSTAALTITPENTTRFFIGSISLKRIIGGNVTVNGFFDGPTAFGADFSNYYVDQVNLLNSHPIFIADRSVVFSNGSTPQICYDFGDGTVGGLLTYTGGSIQIGDVGNIFLLANGDTLAWTGGVLGLPKALGLGTADIQRSQILFGTGYDPGNLPNLIMVDGGNGYDFHVGLPFQEGAGASTANWVAYTVKDGDIIFKRAKSGSLTEFGRIYGLTGNHDILGKVSKYNAIATAGYGVPAIVDSQSLTNQGADITTTNFTNAGVAGLYRVSYSLQDTTADITAGAVILTIAYTDGAGSTTSTATQLLTGTGRQSGVIYIQLASGNITYAISHTGIFGSAKYALHMTCERVN